MSDDGTGRVFAQKIVAIPVMRGPDRPMLKPSPAIGADIVQNMLHAIRTERALITANPRLRRIRQQRLVAVLTGMSEF